MCNIIIQYTHKQYYYYIVSISISITYHESSPGLPDQSDRFRSLCDLSSINNNVCDKKR